MSARFGRRRLVSRLFTAACALAAAVAVVPLFSVIGLVAVRGAGSLDRAFFTSLPAPVGEPGGGIAHAILGSVLLVGTAAAMALPVGILGGVFLSEFGRSGHAAAVRFAADVLAGIPSIVVGMFVYAVVVRPMGGPSGLAGSIALAIVMLPTLVRTTEELMRLVPRALREAGWALGIPEWRTIVSIVLRTALPGIATGVLLAVARAAGETAPLLFTAQSNRYWPEGIDQPTASLPVQIFNYAVAPYDDWNRQAWGAAFVLLVGVLALNVFARLFTGKPGGGAR